MNKTDRRTQPFHVPVLPLHDPTSKSRPIRSDTHLRRTETPDGIPTLAPSSRAARSRPLCPPASDSRQTLGCRLAPMAAASLDAMEAALGPGAALSFLSPFGESFHTLLLQPSDPVPNPGPVVGCRLLLEAFPLLPDLLAPRSSCCLLFYRTASHHPAYAGPAWSPPPPRSWAVTLGFLAVAPAFDLPIMYLCDTGIRRCAHHGVAS